MRLYILRHGIATSRSKKAFAGDDRPLTNEGKQKMLLAARGIKTILKEPPSFILTSPLRRAHDTAKIVAKVMRKEKNIRVVKFLLPEISTTQVLRSLIRYSHVQNLMIVGHEPQLSSLIASLLGGKRSAFELRKGGLCLLETHLGKLHDGKMLFFLTPRTLRKIEN